MYVIQSRTKEAGACWRRVKRVGRADGAVMSKIDRWNAKGTAFEYRIVREDSGAQVYPLTN